MSTLNEIAANHARMAKAKEEESIRLGEFHRQIVGSFEMPCIEAKPKRALSFMAAVQEQTLMETAGYRL